MRCRLPSRCPTILCVICLIMFGALNTLSTKITFQIESIGLDGNLVPFWKPWFGVYRMFQGRAFVIIFHILREARHYRKREKEKRIRSSSHHFIYVAPELRHIVEGRSCVVDVPEPAPWKAYILVGIPAVLDLLGTACTYVGVNYVIPSVWLMLRGSQIVFAVLFSITVLKRSMCSVRWVGVAICVIALILVGFADLKATSPDEVKTGGAVKLFGVGMIVLGMGFASAQIVAEELLMKRDSLSVHPLMVVGMEGLWGVGLMLAVVFPLLRSLPGGDVGDCLENFDNDFEMLRNSPALEKAILVYMLSVFCYNTAGIFVIYTLSAVHRTMLDAMRTALVWLCGLVFHYQWPRSPYGEVWTHWSFLELAGFVLMMLGQATYSESFTWVRWRSRSRSRDLEGPLLPPSRTLTQRCILRSPTISPQARMDLGVDLPDFYDVS